MKFNWCRKILKEETVEMKDTAFGTIEKLRLSNEMVQNKGKINNVFFCNEEGLFSVAKHRNTTLKSNAYYSQYRGELCYLKGKVFQQNQKTYIKYQIVYNPLIYFSILFICALCLAFNLYLIIFIGGSKPALLRSLSAILSIFLGIYAIIEICKMPKTVAGLGLTKMEEELLWRIDAVNNWDK